MVVTSSRLHAVRYKQAIDAYIAKMKLHRPGGAGGLLGHGRSTRRADLHRVADERLPRVPDRREVRR